MPRFRQPTIAEKGGLRVHLESVAISYEIFALMVRAGNKNTEIARTLSVDRQKRISTSTVKHWREELARESANESKNQ